MTTTKKSQSHLITVRDEYDAITLSARYPSQHFTSVHAAAYRIGAAIYAEMAKMPRNRRGGLGFGFRVDLDSPCCDDTFLLRWEMAVPSGLDQATGQQAEVEARDAMVRLSSMAEKLAKGLHRVSSGGGEIAWVSIPE